MRLKWKDYPLTTGWLKEFQGLLAQTRKLEPQANMNPAQEN